MNKPLYIGRCRVGGEGNMPPKLTAHQQAKALEIAKANPANIGKLLSVAQLKYVLTNRNVSIPGGNKPELVDAVKNVLGLAPGVAAAVPGQELATAPVAQRDDTGPRPPDNSHLVTLTELAVHVFAQWHAASHYSVPSVTANGDVEQNVSTLARLIAAFSIVVTPNACKYLAPEAGIKNKWEFCVRVAVVHVAWTCIKYWIAIDHLERVMQLSSPPGAKTKLRYPWLSWPSANAQPTDLRESDLREENGHLISWTNDDTEYTIFGFTRANYFAEGENPPAIITPMNYFEWHEWLSVLYFMFHISTEAIQCVIQGKWSRAVKNMFNAPECVICANRGCRAEGHHGSLRDLAKHGGAWMRACIKAVGELNPRTPEDITLAEVNDMMRAFPYTGFITATTGASEPILEFTRYGFKRLTFNKGSCDDLCTLKTKLLEVTCAQDNGVVESPFSNHKNTRQNELIRAAVLGDFFGEQNAKYYNVFNNMFADLLQNDAVIRFPVEYVRGEPAEMIPAWLDWVDANKLHQIIDRRIGARFRTELGTLSVSVKCKGFYEATEDKASTLNATHITADAAARMAVLKQKAKKDKGKNEDADTAE